MRMQNIPKSEFINNLLYINQIDKNTFGRWLFYPGMLFGSLESWWGTGKKRKSYHEGVDFCHYLDTASMVKLIPSQIKIPVMYDGIIRLISDDDYLGQTIYVSHPQYWSETGQVLNTIYAHASPFKNIKPGSIIKAGKVVSQVIDFEKAGAKMLRHVHLTMAMISTQSPASSLKWENMARLQEIQLIAPLGYADCQYSIHKYFPEH